MRASQVVCALLVLAIHGARAHGAGPRNATHKRQEEHHEQHRHANDTTRPSELLDAAPTITSVHQVWTSSSSGRLDELSPEMIGRLRNDVPFLAAYALRPRLVGAGAGAALESRETPDARFASLQVAPLSTQKQPQQAGQLETAASGRPEPRVAPPAGDFSEYSEETSSLSKSEHHHRRKTSLKRPRSQAATAGGPLEFSSSSLRRRRVSASASTGPRNADSLGQLVKGLRRQRQQQQVLERRRRRNSPGGKARTASSKSTGKRKAAKARKQRRGSRAGPAKVSRARPKHRLPLQAQTKSASDVDGSGGDVKGGAGARDPKETPFYASTRPAGVASEASDATDEPSSPNALDDRVAATDASDAAQGGATQDEDEDENEPEPKRVGDGDVDEELGDTVLVEPKFDGVDDDPPLPESPDELDAEEGDGTGDGSGNRVDDDRDLGAPAVGGGGVGGAGSASGSGTKEGREEEGPGAPKLAPEGDPRGTRVNRQKPNPPQQPERDEREEGGGGGGQAVGGGIGATVGGSSQSGGGGGAADANDGDGANGGSKAGGGGGGGHSVGTATPGVEFAGRDGDDHADDERGARDSPAQTAGNGRDSANGAGSSTSGAGGDGGEFGDRRQPGARGGGSVGDGHGDGNGGNEDDPDLDYRDEMADAERAGTRGPSGSAGRDPGGAHEGAKSPGPTEDKREHRAHGGQNCDEGHDHHHDHHNTIEWLRDAVPGEPDDDYPILSRVNATNFKCSTHKHPGYYADVDARCQIFHICQADGRQDSFLCPNGTIFSQRTLVCVWWNGFDCEDAPKFYHLNELLYKTPNGSESPQAAALDGAGALRPLAGPLRPKGMRAPGPGSERDGASPPIDGLVSAMRGRGPAQPRDATGNAIGAARGHSDGDAAGPPRAALGPEDEASIQRKSTGLHDGSAADDADAGDEPPARLTRASRDRVPRRRRRASTRQAPPKLKSRRVSRNSRRRRLRHGIKPRRRA